MPADRAETTWFPAFAAHSPLSARRMCWRSAAVPFGREEGCRATVELTGAGLHC